MSGESLDDRLFAVTSPGRRGEGTFSKFFYKDPNP